MNIQFPSCSTRRVAAPLVLAFTAFVASWAVGGSSVATYVNTGLVTALHSVGQQLLGTSVFSVHAQPIDPCQPTDPCTPSVALDYGDFSAVPIQLNVFDQTLPTDPCRTYVQVSIADGVAVVKYDTSTQPQGFMLEPADLSAVVPTIAQCSAAAPTCTPGDATCI
jgi:hypothetical protein